MISKRRQDPYLKAQEIRLIFQLYWYAPTYLRKTRKKSFERVEVKMECPGNLYFNKYLLPGNFRKRSKLLFVLKIATSLGRKVKKNIRSNDTHVCLKISRFSIFR